MSERNEIQPALSPEEWADGGRDLFDGHVNVDDGVVDTRLGGIYGVGDAGRDRHALAALCLHGQPFGFTREDVAFLRGAYLAIADRRQAYHAKERFDSIADRISALLPPEEP